MNIKFTFRKEKYALISDSRQFILMSNRDSIYFTKIEPMLEYLYDMGLRDNTVDSFRALVRHSESIRDEVLRVGKLFTLTGG